MLCGKKYDVDVWRSLPATGVGNWGDLPWSYSHTFRGTIQPFEGSDATRNNQRFSNARYLVVCALDEDVTEEDELVFFNEYNRIVYMQPFRSGLISHWEIYTADTQEDKTAD